MTAKGAEQKSKFKGAASDASYRRLLPIIFCFVIWWLATAGAVLAQPSVRLAVVDFVGDDRGEAAAWLRSLARESESPSFELIDEELVRVAKRGAGYDGGLNLSREEARALGQSLGCDFYILGKILVARRAVSSEQFYFEALSGLFLVETRTGALALFALDRTRAGGEQQAHTSLKELIGRRWPRFTEAVASAKQKHAAEIENTDQASVPVVEVFSEDINAQGLEPPVFYQRLKPVYTEQADLAGVTATVELEAVFGPDGRVGEVQVVRWGGFGLDESAVATVRQLRFQPAKRGGKSVTIRGLVRYNFRRPHSQAVVSPTASPEEIERIRRRLRDALNPKRFPAKPPNF